jgi:cysteine-rich repeat protein
MPYAGGGQGGSAAQGGIAAAGHGGGGALGGSAGHGGGSAGTGGAGTGGQGGNAGRAGNGGAGNGGAGNGGAGNGGAGNGGAGNGGAGNGGAGNGGAGNGGAGNGGAGNGGAGNGGAGNGGAGNGAGSGGTAGAPPVCGNQLLEKGEQCDDGNTKNLDACDASCDFEQSQRANSFEQKFLTSSLCPDNAFGAAFEAAAQSALQATLNERIESGSLSLLLAFRNLADLSGNTTESLTLGVAYGSPSVAPNYDGRSDLDWWYAPAAGQVDGGVLYSNTTASIVAGVLNANPGSIQLPLFSDVPVHLSSAKVRLSLGAASEPLTSSGTAPGHLANEHLRPGLVSFESGGPPPPDNGDPGQLCANLSAASLSALAIPAAYASGGSSPCREGYAAARSFLDLLVGGCTFSGDELVSPTQPDQADPNAPQGGAGAPYRLIANATSNAVVGCRDKNNASVTLATCLNAAAYSSAYRLKTGRVIIK